MNPTINDALCELCKTPANYQPKLNRVLCVQHLHELEAEREIHLSTVKNVEYLATDILNKHKLTLSRNKVIEIMQTASNKALNELVTD